MLRGKCADCKEPISAQYLTVEALTGLLFAAVAYRIGFNAELPIYLYLAAIAVVLSLIDLKLFRLPDEIVKPSAIVTAVLLVVATAFGETNLSDLKRAGLGAVAIGIFYYLPYKITNGKGMGFGDVKLAPTLGAMLAFLGWGPFCVGFMAAFFIGAVVGVGLTLTVKDKTGKSKIPFGPFMLGGALLGVLFGVPLFDQYLKLFGLA